jgi:hypothetical protein
MVDVGDSGSEFLPQYFFLFLLRLLRTTGLRDAGGQDQASHAGGSSRREHREEISRQIY